MDLSNISFEWPLSFTALALEAKSPRVLHAVILENIIRLEIVLWVYSDR
jgi:hypothetical protein